MKYLKIVGWLSGEECKMRLREENKVTHNVK